MSSVEVPGETELGPLPPQRSGRNWHYLWFWIGGILLVVLVLLGWTYGRLLMAVGPLEVKSDVIAARVFSTGVPPPDDPMWDPALQFPDDLYDQLDQLMRAAGPPKRVDPAICNVTLAFGINMDNGTTAACYVPVAYNKTDGHIAVHWAQSHGEWKVVGFWLRYDDRSALGDLNGETVSQAPTP